jgi:hypothetical protein
LKVRQRRHTRSSHGRPPARVCAVARHKRKPVAAAGGLAATHSHGMHAVHATCQLSRGLPQAGGGARSVAGGGEEGAKLQQGPQGSGRWKATRRHNRAAPDRPA